MTCHATPRKRSTITRDQRLTPKEWAAVLARGIRANLAPCNWLAERDRLIEGLISMADARRGDAAVIRQRNLARIARCDAAVLEAVANELGRQLPDEQ